MRIQRTIYLLTLLLSFILFTNCDNDDGNAVNQDDCNYAGLTALIQGINTLIPESNLQTDYFPNNGSGAAVEVYEITNPGNNFIVTTALTVGAIDTNPQITIGGTSYSGTITCQRAGSQVGEELRLDIVLTGNNEAELCVVIDTVSP